MTQRFVLSVLRVGRRQATSRPSLQTVTSPSGPSPQPRRPHFIHVPSILSIPTPSTSTRPTTAQRRRTNSFSSLSCTLSIPTQPKSSTSRTHSPLRVGTTCPLRARPVPVRCPPARFDCPPPAETKREGFSTVPPMSSLLSSNTGSTPETPSATASTRLTAERRPSPSLPNMTPLLCQQPPISLQRPCNPIYQSTHGQPSNGDSFGRSHAPSLSSVNLPTGNSGPGATDHRHHFQGSSIKLLIQARGAPEFVYASASSSGSTPIVSACRRANGKRFYRVGASLMTNSPVVWRGGDMYG
jgi:hypothetical protein